LWGFGFLESFMETIFSDLSVSIGELKRNFSGVIKQADDEAVAILNHNRPEAYLLSAKHYEQLLSYMEDLEDEKLVRERANGVFVEVNIDDL
jgi:antitoxin StbD